jgi:hypothetical protein
VSDNRKTAFDVIQEQAQKIGFGEWPVNLIIYNGRVTGFDQIEQPKVKFRESQAIKKE